MKKLLLLLLLLPTVLSAEVVMHRQVATWDLSGDGGSGVELYRLKVPPGDVTILVRMQVENGTGGGGHVCILQGNAEWDRTSSVESIMSMLDADGTTSSTNLIITNVANAAVHTQLFWKTVATNRNGVGMPPYLNLNVIENYTGGTLTLYLYVYTKE